MGLKFDTVLFDNMSIKNLKKVSNSQKNITKQKHQETLASKMLALLLTTGVDRISVGSITHSAPSVDFKLEF